MSDETQTKTDPQPQRERYNAKGPIVRRSVLYAKTAKHAYKAINVLVSLLDSQNEAIKLGAAKTLLAKTLPDLKAEEITGKYGSPIAVRIIGDYLSQPGFNAPPINSAQGSNEVQSPSMAPEEQENINTIGEDGAGSAQPAP